jgi:hypothetical protein
VQGGILDGKSWTIQPLTEGLRTGPTTDIQGQGERIGRLLCSLRAALNALKARFIDVKDIPAPKIPPVFPFFASFFDIITQTEEAIIYEDRLHYQEGSQGTAIFSARLRNGDAIFVKFVTRYNVPAHHLLALEGLAPRLRYCSERPEGGAHIAVVMDRILGHHMHDEIFRKEDLARVQRAKKLLHESNYVFGDLRPNNVFKPTDGTGVVLVDFDWCGQDGVDTYPLFVNKACGWHPEVRGGAVMRKVHDDYLFDKFRRS